jgi:hypothetical protein
MVEVHPLAFRAGLSSAENSNYRRMSFRVLGHFELINKATRDALITGYESLIELLTLPDPDDRHVLAAAIVGRCDVIVTTNSRISRKRLWRPSISRRSIRMNFSAII